MINNRIGYKRIKIKLLNNMFKNADIMHSKLLSTIWHNVHKARKESSKRYFWPVLKSAAAK